MVPALHAAVEDGGQVMGVSGDQELAGSYAGGEWFEMMDVGGETAGQVVTNSVAVDGVSPFLKVVGYLVQRCAQESDS